MFYLKYRPKKIEEIDNERVKDIVKNILKEKTPPHALLFIGQKGTGKTSTARIFAKAVNCQENKFNKKNSSAIEPCGKCSNCAMIDNSTSPDVVEMDAASNRGIEDIKKLIKEAAFFPMNTKYRVFIIDEAHMITTDAFNALLKTLEEPPSSVIFILATTNLEKIPKTIVSRCSIVNFGKAKKSDIIDMLNRIAKGENLKTDEKLFSLIATQADKSFRDAAKSYEELVIQNKLNYEDAKNFLGVARNDFWEVIKNRNLAKTLAWIKDFSGNGGNVKNLIEELLEELHVSLLATNGVSIEVEESIKLNKTEIVLLLKLLSEAYQNLRYSPIESLPLELAIVEFYNKSKPN